MSNSLAIAAVTRTIQLMLQRFADIEVTTKSPDQAAADGQGARINLFLYHTMPNPAWRNRDLPGRVAPGALGDPPLALNLYYLLTAYGEDGADLADQRTLGQAMQVLHDRPIIKRATIESFLPPDLLASGLHEQVEHVRIAPDTLNIEEMSRLWTTFQTQYRVSAAYQAAVVLIESQRPARSALPVAKRGEDDRGVRTDVGLDAVLESIEYRADERQPPLPAATVGDTIAIRGSNLPTQGLTVVVRDPKRVNGSGDDNVVARLTPTSVGDGKTLSVVLDEDAGVWPAGVLSLEVEQTKQDGVAVSNSLPLALAPNIQTVSGSPVSFISEEADRRLLSISLQHPLGRDRRVHLVLNRFEETGDTSVVRGSAQQQTFFQLPISDDQTGVASLNPIFDITSVPPGVYWSRVRVDGIDSLLMTRQRNAETNAWRVEFDPQQRITI